MDDATAATTDRVVHAPVDPPRRDGDLWHALCTCGHETTGGSERRAGGRLTAHVNESNRVPCPHPEKNAYRWRTDAEQEAVKIWRRLRGGPRLRAYRCECKRWHLTSTRQIR